MTSEQIYSEMDEISKLINEIQDKQMALTIRIRRLNYLVRGGTK